MSKTLETLREKTEAALAKYVAAVTEEQEALAARLSKITTDTSASEAVSVYTAKPIKKRGRPKGSKNKTAKAPKKTTDAVAKSRRQQWKYISLIRQFSGGEKEVFQGMARADGRAKAIKAMKDALKVKKAA